MRGDPGIFKSGAMTYVVLQRDVWRLQLFGTHLVVLKHHVVYVAVTVDDGHAGLRARLHGEHAGHLLAHERESGHYLAVHLGALGEAVLKQRCQESQRGCTAVGTLRST